MAKENELFNPLLDKFANDVVDELKTEPSILTPYKTGKMNETWRVSEINSNRAVVDGIWYAEVQEYGAPLGQRWKGFIFRKDYKGAFNRAEKKNEGFYYKIISDTIDDFFDDKE